jgi:hypothetical protein
MTLVMWDLCWQLKLAFESPSSHRLSQTYGPPIRKTIFRHYVLKYIRCVVRQRRHGNISAEQFILDIEGGICRGAEYLLHLMVHSIFVPLLSPHLFWTCLENVTCFKRFPSENSRHLTLEIVQLSWGCTSYLMLSQVTCTIEPEWGGRS